MEGRLVAGACSHWQSLLFRRPVGRHGYQLSLKYKQARKRGYYCLMSSTRATKRLLDSSLGSLSYIFYSNLMKLFNQMMLICLLLAIASVGHTANATCSTGQYYNSNLSLCITCSAGCASCCDESLCSSCLSGKPILMQDMPFPQHQEPVCCALSTVIPATKTTIA